MLTSSRRLRCAFLLVLVTIILGLGHEKAFAQGMPGVINPLSYPGADLCLQIQAAISANATTFPQGLIVDARSATGVQGCSVNPFAGATVPGQLLLGETILQTTAPIVTPSIQAWQISGVGRGNPPNATGTVIQAVSGFPVNGKVVRLGDGTNLTFGTRISNLAIDCNSISGLTGLYSTDIQEQSGGSYLVITSCPSHGLWVDGSGVSSGVAPYADNYAFHDVEVNGFAGSFATVGCEFDGNFATQGNGPHQINALTCSGAVTDFIFDGITAAHISNLNAEHATTGYLISNSAPLNGVSFDGLNSGTITGAVVHIQSVVAPLFGNFNQGLSFRSIVNGGAFAPVTLQDDLSGITLHDFILGEYTVGTKLPRTGAGYTRETSSLGAANVMGQLTLENGSDVVNVLRIGAGNTASQGSLLEFEDRGTPTWNMGRNAPGDFQIFDITNNLLRFYAPSGAFPYTGIASYGAAPVLFNLFPGSGTGGVQFGSGGASPTTVANITSTGAATVTSLYITGLGASPHPLCTTTGGLVVNTGCSAPVGMARPGEPVAMVADSATTVFGRSGAVVAAAGDYDVTQINGAAPLNSPTFTGSLRAPSVAGTGMSSFLLGGGEVVGGADATAACAAGHACDSVSGTVLLTTGGNAIASQGLAMTINLPLARQSLPNCVVSVSGETVKKPVLFTVSYPTTASIAIGVKEQLLSASAYDVTYFCGGN